MSSAFPPELHPARGSCHERNRQTHPFLSSHKTEAKPSFPCDERKIRLALFLSWKRALSPWAQERKGGQAGRWNKGKPPTTCRPCCKVSTVLFVLVPASDIFSNSFFEDLDKLLLLREWIPAPDNPCLLEFNG